MQLSEFYEYKNQLMEDLLTNAEIVRLLCDGNVPEDVRSLVYTQVFPFEYIPETLEHGATYICCDVDIQRVDSRTYLTPSIQIWLFSHKSKLRLPEGGVRTDRLSAEIAETINGSRNYGLGELELYSVRRFAPIPDYQGKVMTFRAKEINRLGPNTMPIPERRGNR